MFKKLLIALSVTIVLIPVSAYARNFLRPLRLGDYGEDVRFVQKVLNLSPQTHVAATGPGSPGNETALFGLATRAALMKMQALYASDILTPAGVTAPTGVAGNYTLAKINQLYDAYIKSQKTAQNTARSNYQTTGTPFIISATPTALASGGTLHILGKNFTQNNTVLVSLENNNKFTGIFSANSTDISFSLNIALSGYMEQGLAKLSPQARAEAISDLIAKGKFVTGPEAGAAYLPANISVKNENGTSNSVPVLVRILSA